MNVSKSILALGLLISLAPLAGCSTIGEKEAAEWPRYTLSADKILRLNAPGKEAFDASGLLLAKNGDLLTVSDHGPTLYRIQLPASGDAANVQPLTNSFTTAQLAAFHPYRGHYDCEGIAQDEQGRLYLCEEGNRWILRCDPVSNRVEVLPIDWTPVEDFFSSDRNASFEGIAIGNGKLYVANERSAPLIIVLDLQTLKILDHFVVHPKAPSFLGFLHYSDLSWYDGKLYVLCRHHRVILEVEPQTHAVLAEYSYQEIEDKLGYKTLFPTGVMEGLAVDKDSFWLGTDNNGLGRITAPDDLRPTVVKCPRPKKKE